MIITLVSAVVFCSLTLIKLNSSSVCCTAPVYSDFTDMLRRLINCRFIIINYLLLTIYYYYFSSPGSKDLGG